MALDKWEKERDGGRENNKFVISALRMSMTIGSKGPTIKVTQEDSVSALRYSSNEVRRNSSTSSPSKTNTRSKSGDRTGGNSSGSRKSSMTILESNNGSSSKHFHTHQEENRWVF